MKSEANFEHCSEPYARTESEERRNRQGVHVSMRFPLQIYRNHIPTPPFRIHGFDDFRARFFFCHSFGIALVDSDAARDFFLLTFQKCLEKFVGSRLQGNAFVDFGVPAHSFPHDEERQTDDDEREQRYRCDQDVVHVSVPDIRDRFFQGGKHRIRD